MKIFKNIRLTLLGAVLATGVVACDDYLDRPPLSQVTPENYLWSESDLAAYAINRYNQLPSHTGWSLGLFARDNNTDNQIQASGNNNGMFVPGNFTLETRAGGGWNWGELYNINYFLRTVMPRYGAGGPASQIAGNETMIRHYIGEVYFFRAWFYFDLLTVNGDLPIIYGIYNSNQKEELIAASIRQPRDKVADMIMADLDSALMFMSDAPSGGKNRLSKGVANLIKSRAALYEGSFEKNFAGTAYVPNGQGWPGAKTHPGYVYDNQTSVNKFLTIAKDAAKLVADAYALTPSVPNYDERGMGPNPYFDMFAAENMEGYSEVMMWRAYNDALGVYHAIPSYIFSGGNTGFTRGYMESFLTQSGLPIYAPGSGYVGDDSITMVKTNRDYRLKLFVRGTGEVATPVDVDTWAPNLTGTPVEDRSATGYGVKKGLMRNTAMLHSGSGAAGYRGTTGCVMFRSAEAYLNYIEASYLLTGAIDGTASAYWQALRTRAGVDPDFDKTIAATDMSKEKLDWGAYTAGTLISPTEYNIRRERRSEFIADGFRWNDLVRWRAMDQLRTNKYVFEGVNLWTSMYTHKNYEALDKDKQPTGKSVFIEGPVTYKDEEGKDVTPNMSNRSQSVYFQPWSILKKDNALFDGCSFTSAAYLTPLMPAVFKNTAKLGADGKTDIESSPVYQNPGWGKTAGKPATEVY